MRAGVRWLLLFSGRWAACNSLVRIDFFTVHYLQLFRLSLDPFAVLQFVICGLLYRVNTSVDAETAIQILVPILVPPPYFILNVLFVPFSLQVKLTNLMTDVLRRESMKMYFGKWKSFLMHLHV